MSVPTTDGEKARYIVEMEKLKYVAGRPDVVGPNPPPPPVQVPKGADGKPLWDESRPFEDRPLNRGLEYLRKKLAGVGVRPPLPERIPA
jgi:carboxyl-terminal processing protease